MPEIFLSIDGSFSFISFINSEVRYSSASKRIIQSVSIFKFSNPQLNCLAISNPKDIQRLLVEKFNALISTYADDVILEFQEQEHVKINYAFRLQPDGSSIEIGPQMRLGPILRDTSLQVLFEFLVNPSALNEDVATLLNGSLKDFRNSASHTCSPHSIKSQA